MTTLVIAEQRQGYLSATVPHLIAAARRFDETVTLLVSGERYQKAVSAVAQLTGLTAIACHSTPAPYSTPEWLAEQLAQRVTAGHWGQVNQIMAAASPFGHAVLPRLAALLDAPLVTNVVAIEDRDNVTRPIHAGTVLATVRLLRRPRLLSIRSSAFATALSLPPQLLWQGERGSDSKERPDLLTADIVVAGGQGVAASGSFALIEALAQQLGAAVGASRSAVDAGVAANDQQIGQTGKIIAPRLYIAVGLSGSLQHLAGVKDAGTIVAINHDPQAPIHAVADFSLVADLFRAVPALIAALQRSAFRPGQGHP
ncbi:MAG: electron transfer flavoprotein subunit alpha/FixB family protein [Magnetococcales bacterium]|nr:electron transfer flavoprotein subunit alpha/FixB family protein [Magnetococcales bacterium]